VTVPGTTSLEGRRVTGATIRPVTGWEELMVADELTGASAVALTDEILRRCVATLHVDGGTEVAAEGRLGELTVGDREVLLLRVRQASFGDRVALVVACHDTGCAALMDLDVDLDRLCRAPAPAARPVRDPPRFRLPTGADQAAVAAQALDDPLGAARALARRCLLDDDPLDDDRLDELGDRLADLDPHADIELDLTCPECGHRFLAPFTAADLLRGELLARRRDLDLAVHLLAGHYHWSEDAILALPTNRRRRYVETLIDATRPAMWE
jgi:hypothetical protein